MSPHRLVPPCPLQPSTAVRVGSLIPFTFCQLDTPHMQSELDFPSSLLSAWYHSWSDATLGPCPTCQSLHMSVRSPHGQPIRPISARTTHVSTQVGIIHQAPPLGTMTAASFCHPLLTPEVCHQRLLSHRLLQITPWAHQVHICQLSPGFNDAILSLRLAHGTLHPSSLQPGSPPDLLPPPIRPVLCPPAVPSSTHAGSPSASVQHATVGTS